MTFEVDQLFIVQLFYNIKLYNCLWAILYTNSTTNKKKMFWTIQKSVQGGSS